MGIAATAIVADSALTDDHLGALGIVPTGRTTSAEEVILRGSSDRVCVVSAETFTVIIGLTDQIAETIESERIAFPGTVVSGAAVSTVGYVDFRVFVDGELRRHLCAEESEVSIDVGVALEGENAFVFPPGDDDDVDSEESNSEGSVREERGVELDGDVLIDSVLEIAGVAPGQSIFDLIGNEYAPPAALGGGLQEGGHGNATQPRATSGDRGFFRRMLGR